MKRVITAEWLWKIVCTIKGIAGYGWAVWRVVLAVVAGWGFRSDYSLILYQI